METAARPPSGGPRQAPDYAEIFKVYIHRLREDFFAKRHKVLRKLNENFLKFTEGNKESLDAKDLEQAQVMLTSLINRFHYCQACARDTVAYLLKKRFAE